MIFLEHCGTIQEKKEDAGLRASCFSVMQLRVAVLDLPRSCVYITQRDVF